MMCLLIYFGLDLVISSDELFEHPEEIADFNFYVAVILILSSGTFLFVATMHILPKGGDDDHGHGDGHNEEEDEYKPKKAEKDEANGTTETSKYFSLFIFIIGCYLPYYATALAEAGE